MTEQSKELSIIDLYAAEKHLQRDDLIGVLMKTIMPRDKNGNDLAGKADLIAFLQIARRFDLDPFAKEIYCLPRRGGGVQAYISVDGYAKIANRQPEYDGCEFDYQQTSEGQFLAVTCTIWRKDRARPTRITEFMNECFKPDSEAWRKNPGRMLRHRAYVQCVRLAFGISGALDEDNAETMINVTPMPREPLAIEDKPAPKAPMAAKKPPSVAAAKAEDKPVDERKMVDPDRSRLADTEQSSAPDIEGFINELHDRLNEAQDVGQLEVIWHDMEVERNVAPNKQMLEYAKNIFATAKAKLEKKK